MLGKTKGRRRMGQQRVRWLNGIANSKEMSLSKLWEIVTEVCGLLQSEGSQRVRPDLVTKQQQSHLSPTVCSHSLSHASTKAQTQCGTNFMGVIQTAHTISTAKGSGEAWIQAALYTALILQFCLALSLPQSVFTTSLLTRPGVFSERCTEKLPLRVDCIHRLEFGEVSGQLEIVKQMSRQ